MTCTPSPTAQLSIGEAPSRDRAFHHALWRQAVTALGHPADALDYATAGDSELREMRDAWRRAQAWAPEFVAEDLHTAREFAEEYRRDAVIWRAGLDLHPVGSAEREMDERDVAAAEHLAAVWSARVEALGRIQAVRTDWLDRTREVQERAAFAGDELERRGRDRDTAAPVGQQQELFAIADHEPDTKACTEADSRPTPSSTSPLRLRRPSVGSTPHSSSSTSTRCRARSRPLDRPGGATPHTPPRPPQNGRPKRSWIRRSIRPMRRPAVRPRPHPSASADSTADGYAALFAEAERAAEREQPALFDAHPTPTDIAAAQPLHLDDPTAGHSHSADADRTDADRTDADRTDDEPIGEDSVLTVSQAARYADFAAGIAARAAEARRHLTDLDHDGEPSGYDYDDADDYGSRAGLSEGPGLST